MSEKVRILSFYENWVDIMEMCNPEEWYELSTIITNLRFKNIDTDPKTLTNIMVKMAWTAIRPSILKSNRNTRYQEKKNNTEIQPNTEFDTEAKISPNEPSLAINDTDVPQEAKSLPEVKIEAKEEEIIIDTNNTEEMGTFIGYAKGFEPAIETRSAAPQMDMNRDKRREEYTANFKKAYNIQAASISEPTKRIEIEEDRSIEHMTKCISTFDLNKAKCQISRAKSVDENMKRVEDCLDPLLEGFSKTERSKLYISIIEDVLNSK